MNCTLKLEASLLILKILLNSYETVIHRSVEI